MSEQVNHIGPFELRGELGRGAMARVWRAWDPNLEREVAIKEPMFADNLPENVLKELGRRFVAEGRAVARLSHPGIVAVYAADVYDGRPAIVMELVDGITLSDLLSQGPLSPSDALAITDQLLDAVGYAHSKGVVHRDIKPDNIFVTKDGHAKLADFGIAHIEDDSTVHATVAGAVLGTPGYMSPEQARGAEVDNRSDLFSTGVIIYEMLTGKNPFGAGAADSTTLIYRIVHEPVPELPDAAVEGLPESFRPALMAALAKIPSERPATAQDMKAMLHGAKAVSEISAAPEAIGVLPLRGQEVTQASFHAMGGAAAAKGKRSFDLANLPKWFPYAAVGAIGAIVLLVALLSAMGGTPRGGSSAQVPPSATATDTAAATASQPGDLGAAYGTVTVTYYQGFGNNEVVGEPVTINAGSSHVVNKWSASSKYGEFAGWIDKSTGKEYKAGDVIENITQDVQLEAQWLSLGMQAGTTDGPASAAGGAGAAATSGGLSAATLPRSWRGSYVGTVNGNQSAPTEMSLTLTNVKDSGSLEGTVVVFTSTDDGRSGSYNVRGSIDYATGAITLSWAGWVNRGDLTVTRSFSGTVSGRSITGTSANMDTNQSSGWSMTAN